MEKNFRTLINEMKLMLNDKPSMVLENFIMPEGFEDHFGEEDMSQKDMPNDTALQKTHSQSKISGIEKELTDIRKIALSVITRLADQPSSEQYVLMKKILRMLNNLTSFYYFTFFQTYLKSPQSHIL